LTRKKIKKNPSFEIKNAFEQRHICGQKMG